MRLVPLTADRARRLSDSVVEDAVGVRVVHRLGVAGGKQDGYHHAQAEQQAEGHLLTYSINNVRYSGNKHQERTRSSSFSARSTGRRGGCKINIKLHIIDNVEMRHHRTGRLHPSCVQQGQWPGGESTIRHNTRDTALETTVAGGKQGGLDHAHAEVEAEGYLLKYSLYLYAIQNYISILNRHILYRQTCSRAVHSMGWMPSLAGSTWTAAGRLPATTDAWCTRRRDIC